MLISSRFSMRYTLERHSPQRKSATPWRSSLTCRRGAYKYGIKNQMLTKSNCMLTESDRFQNKRQSMRQTNRQSTNTSNLPQQSFSVAATAGSSQSSSRGLGTTNPSVETAYITSSQDHLRAHHSSSPHRRDDVLDPRKWSSRGF